MPLCAQHFTRGVATFQYKGAEIYSGGPGALERYDFHVPRLISGYTIRVAGRFGVPGYDGTFWADQATLDVRRLEVTAEEIPPELIQNRGRYDQISEDRAPVSTALVGSQDDTASLIARTHQLVEDGRVQLVQRLVSHLIDDEIPRR